MESYKFNYLEGIRYLNDLYQKSPAANGQFTPYPDIIIRYPGGKKEGDYKLFLKNSSVPKYTDLCMTLYNHAIGKTYTFPDLKSFIEDIYTNGTKTAYNDIQLVHLQNLIFWVTLQEEINYPRSQGYAGVNLAFCRFYEAIYCTRQDAAFTIDDVLQRCNNHNQTRPVLYDLTLKSYIYHY